jgi:transposase-like protein
MAETRTDAEAAFDGFIESYGVKYEKAVECLSKDRGSLLAFYDFPAAISCDARVICRARDAGPVMRRLDQSKVI